MYSLLFIQSSNYKKNIFTQVMHLYHLPPSGHPCIMCVNYTLLLNDWMTYKCFINIIHYFISKLCNVIVYIIIVVIICFLFIRRIILSLWNNIRTYQCIQRYQLFRKICAKMERCNRIKWVVICILNNILYYNTAKKYWILP